MQYKTITDSDRHTCATISTFHAEKGVSEHQLTIQITEQRLPFPEQLKSIFSSFENIRENNLQHATTVFRRIFLSDAANQMHLLPDDLPAETSIIEQPPLSGAKIALWACLQTGVEVLKNHPYGLSVVRHGKYLHLWKGTAIAAEPEHDPEKQMNTLLKTYLAQLQEHGCTLAGNCIRTWIFVQNVDVNYAGIVKARRELFAENGLTEETHYIASTGINGRHANPEAVVILDAYAVKGLEDGQIRYLHATSRMSPTARYGVTFERGTCVLYGDRRHIFISGTASIDDRGKTIHEGDICKQTVRMIENVMALLREAECTAVDVAQIILYLRDMADYATAGSIMEKYFPETPKLIVLAPICRPGWLVEMECFAIGKDSNPDFEPL
jgi:enamine deaminase RidA (YjgF/YER057c/UK114 family)